MYDTSTSGHINQKLIIMKERRKAGKNYTCYDAIICVLTFLYYFLQNFFVLPTPEKRKEELLIFEPTTVSKRGGHQVDFKYTYQGN
jgi:hypothetical protein